MKRVSSIPTLVGQRRFFALPIGSYCVEVVDIAETHAHENIVVGADGMLEEGETRENHTHAEETPQLIVLAKITTGKYKGSKTVYRFPMVGYQKPKDGELNVEERLAAGDTVEGNYWKDKDGHRYVDESSVEKCNANIAEFISACLGDDRTSQELFDDVANPEVEVKCNLNIVQDEYNGRVSNKWAGAFTYDEAYEPKGKAAVVEIGATVEEPDY